MTGKLRKCPECKNWDFDDQHHWCKKEWLRFTYTSLTLPSDEKKIMECYDFDPIYKDKKEDPKVRKLVVQRSPMKRKTFSFK